MRNLYSVRIIRKESQAVQAVYIEEFWKFCGVYTSEYITKYSDTMLDEDIVDCNIILDEDGECAGRSGWFKQKKVLESGTVIYARGIG